MQREVADGSTRHDADKPSTAAVLAVAEERGVDAAELETRLNDVIDPDALDQLFGEERQRTVAPAKVEFTMADCSVVVYADGTATAAVTSPSRKTGATP
ncbi:HalOD1 output domain-containing protein [Halostella sp. PRR32]|uniref:HalOD1 output domain-containing protein n=1 Tax=Halostella sp. PRR32 TaxID=3098147 RepID=UPI002B1DE5C0|nr:HalOD1 output domain-containing protein [Halostella sp. PRR32]